MSEPFPIDQFRDVFQITPKIKNKLQPFIAQYKLLNMYPSFNPGNGSSTVLKSSTNTSLRIRSISHSSSTLSSVSSFCLILGRWCSST